MSFVELKSINKTFGKTTAVSNTNIRIEKGEFFSLLGPSGCGKSTTLRMIAGFIEPTDGQILINGRDITHLPPEERGIGIVFQNYAIFPHMTVFDNIAFGLVERKIKKEIIHEKVNHALTQVGLEGFGERYERELSGGQKQRVALARVLVIEPEILLLDEPLSALDKKMREEMKYWIKEIQSAIGITTIYVTHDQSEALTMSDRISVMNEGQLLQVGTPEEIYEMPSSRFIAEFIGNSNLLEITVVEKQGDQYVVNLGEGAEMLAQYSGSDQIPNNTRHHLLLRPELLRLFPNDTNEQPKLKGAISGEDYQGALKRYKVTSEKHNLILEVPNRAELTGLKKDDEVSVYWDEHSAVIILSDA